MTGSKALGNSFGVYLRGQQSGLEPSLTLGGTAAGARNLISGNRAEGVRLEWSNGSVIQGNFIGTDVTGTAKVGNNNAVALFDSGRADGRRDRGRGRQRHLRAAEPDGVSPSATPLTTWSRATLSAATSPARSTWAISAEGSR